MMTMPEPPLPLLPNTLPPSPLAPPPFPELFAPSTPDETETP